MKFLKILEFYLLSTTVWKIVVQRIAQVIFFQPT